MLHVSILGFEKRVHKNSENNLDQSLNLFLNLLRVSYAAILEKSPSFYSSQSLCIIFLTSLRKTFLYKFISVYFICSAYFGYSIAVSVIAILMLITEEDYMKMFIYTTWNCTIIEPSKQQKYKNVFQ